MLASDAAAFDYFGFSVAIDGVIAVVGAFGRGPIGGGSVGRTDGGAYVFRYNGVSWVEETVLVSSDLAPDDLFGYQVAVAGDRILATAPYDDDLGGYSGSAYVFRHDGTRWVEEQKLLASDGAAEDNFGRSCDLESGVLVIGAPKTFGPAMKHGSAYVFRSTGPVWLEVQSLAASDATALDWFGMTCALDSDRIAVGAPSQENRRYGAYLFRRSGAMWIEEQKLTPSQPGPFDNFGQGIELDSDTLLVGAFGDIEQAYLAGAAYVYHFDGTRWGNERKLLASDPVKQDQLGVGVALEGDVGVVGTDVAAFPGRVGRAYVFDVSSASTPILCRWRRETC